ncbi:prolyl-tRNA synthetase associated domain-containing protein [Endozoicomonas sp. SM1973]|uniref:Prolyl-tRNA synthetase associated domain-containing protein n=1 Tax=Spartinivicinus marinus TaxID=2994442 RepID=A0A853IAG3_9GAMM|nr:prolyl-tRNA synthetase associated domain-containing protein [Spartinivicinus marinus]MCX4027038.1 prolyl-tRNA synthetase associated domain-containing protein [Spartinivicinus marinus]NYZ67034.1 prolyl-tRNA synthetase associated domain-containing protein [Spartinivicinus marinus]
MKLFDFLSTHNISFEQYEHPPLYTCEDANQLASHIPGAKTKNLFLRDRKGKRHFLVVVNDHKVIDLSNLSVLLETSKLSFASADRLKQYLGIEPGAVSLLSLINDQNQSVELLIDKDVWACPTMQCHPLVNTSTLVIPMHAVEKFIRATGHELQLILIPE